MIRVTLIAALSASAASAATVVFCAPPELRAPVAAAIVKEGHQPLDLSELDDVLFSHAGKTVQLPATLPQEVLEDFEKGAAGCASRAQQDQGDQRACAEHLASAVWQRHLERLRPERVIEVKVIADLLDGVARSVEFVTYEPADATLSSAMLNPKITDAQAVAAQVVESALSGAMTRRGGRPSSNVLPGKVPLPPASLSAGAPQHLEGLVVPEGCALPSKLVVSPPAAPLAITVSTLWDATVAGHVRAGAKPLRCSLELKGPKGKPAGLAFQCGGELSMIRLYPGTKFDDAGFQAALASAWVRLELDAQCKPTRR